MSNFTPRINKLVSKNLYGDTQHGKGLSRDTVNLIKFEIMGQLQIPDWSDDYHEYLSWRLKNDAEHRANVHAIKFKIAGIDNTQRKA